MEVERIDKRDLEILLILCEIPVTETALKILGLILENGEIRSRDYKTLNMDRVWFSQKLKVMVDTGILTRELKGSLGGWITPRPSKKMVYHYSLNYDHLRGLLIQYRNKINNILGGLENSL